MAAEPVNPAGEAPRPAGGPPSRRGAALLGAVILWVGLLLLLRHFDHRYTLPTIRATAGDLLTRPGEEVTLLVHLERHAADGTVERAGIDVDLRLASEDPTRGIVSTDPDGIARRAITAPTEPGIHPIAVDPLGSFAGDEGIRFDPVVSVLAPGEPWILCELGPVLSGDTSADGVPALSRAAVFALEELRRGRVIVFLDADGAGGSDLVRRALRLGGAPLSAVLGGRSAGEDGDAVRRRVLATTLGEVSAPALAITASRSGCALYREAAIPTIVIGGTACEGAIEADSWSTAKRRAQELVPGSD
ncbi:MAG: hypothetical protein ACO4BJ_00610 [Planctomycetota bacterium]|jgi:hypothetical protein